jgi:hypothetical protein
VILNFFQIFSERMRVTPSIFPVKNSLHSSPSLWGCLKRRGDAPRA